MTDTHNNSVSRATATTALRIFLGQLARTVVDGALPPRCFSCGVLVESHGALCRNCWGKLTLLGPPCCQRCGFPFPYEAPGQTICPACIARSPIYDRARAVFVYDDDSRALILRFKHADATHSAPFFGRWLARAGAELLADADLIVPVPLHRWRLLRRRYNQSALLAHALARQADKALLVDGLRRRRATPSQGRLSQLARRRNVQGAFAVRREAATRVSGRRILLIDDVLTTGATVEECAKALYRAGAEAVDVLTLARVVRPQ